MMSAGVVRTEGVRRSDKFIPWYFVLFFAVIFTVNGFFMYKAFKTFPALVTENSYEKGLVYDETLAERRAFEKMGIISDITFGDDVFSFVPRDKSGLIKGAEIQVSFIRPVQAGHDFSVALNEKMLGNYAQDVIFPLTGQWQAKIEMTWNKQGEKQTYQMNHRFIVR